MSGEKIRNNKHESSHSYSAESLNELRETGKERVKASLENQEAKREKYVEAQEARKEAEEALNRENINHRQEKELKAEAKVREKGPITKRDKERSFKRTMQTVQSEMSSPSRSFSKVIHNPAIEKTSEVVGNTIVRPNAILSGSIFAFLFTLAIYLTARFNGYPLSGTETIAAFALGWLCGTAFDALRIIVTGKR